MKLHDFGDDRHDRARRRRRSIDLTQAGGDRLMTSRSRSGGRPAVAASARCASTRSTRRSGLASSTCSTSIKDQHDGTLAYRKSCRMMICGSCGMRMDGRAVLACKERMKPIVERGPRPGDLRDGEHAGAQGPRRRHGAVLGEDPRRQALARPGYDEVAEKERIVSQQQMNVIHKEALCIMCGAASRSATRWSPTRSSRGRQALAKASASPATRETKPTSSASTA